jgi:GntR family transcriptional regulator
MPTRRSATSATRSVPFYKQVAATIRSRIADGTYPVGECLPSSAELEEAFGVSNITMRKALAALRSEGLIETRLGVGIVVVRTGEADVVDIRHSGHFTEWLQWASGKSQNVRQRVLSITTERGPDRIRRMLEVSGDDRIWCMRRLRTRSGEPISYHISYGRLEFAEIVRRKDFHGSGSFIEFLQDRYPKKIIRIEQHVEASVANMDLAELLQIDYGAPIFFMEHLYIAEDERVVAISNLYMRADRYRYSTSIDPTERAVR